VRGVAWGCVEWRASSTTPAPPSSHSFINDKPNYMGQALALYRKAFGVKLRLC
jgi:hypothetical protein